MFKSIRGHCSTTNLYPNNRALFNYNSDWLGYNYTKHKPFIKKKKNTGHTKVIGLDRIVQSLFISLDHALMTRSQQI